MVVRQGEINIASSVSKGIDFAFNLLSLPSEFNGFVQ